MALKESGILLTSQYDNFMALNGELGWFTRDYNPSTGYTWLFRPDNSCVYELVEQIALFASTQAVGVPGMLIWKFKATRRGAGYAQFELYPPGATVPVETVTVNITVV